jgi:hypothetical protein
MIARSLAALVVCPFLFLPAAPAAPRQDTLTALVASEVGAADRKDLPELWKRAVALREAEPLGEKGALDRALDEWLLKPAELGQRAALLVSASRLLGTAPDVSRLADALSPLVDGSDADLAAGAAQLLSDSAFKALAPSRRDQLANKMLERGQDAALAPALRLEFAKAAYRSGGGKERIKANKILRNFLDSQDPELKAEGALALAELDAAVLEGDLRTTL